MASATQGGVQDRATEAFLKQTRIDETLDRYARTLVSDETRRHLGNVAFVAKIAIERNLTLRWEF